MSFQYIQTNQLFYYYNFNKKCKKKEIKVNNYNSNFRSKKIII